MRLDPFRKPVWWKAYSFALVTLLLFGLSWFGQFYFQAVEFAADAQSHGEAATMAEYWPVFLAATFENWQSEFLQLVWQAAGLALFYHWGSSQSKESDERLEAKVDALLRRHGFDPDTLR